MIYRRLSWPTKEPQRIIPKYRREEPTEFSRLDPPKYYIAARGLEEPCASFPDFRCQFHVITVFPLVNNNIILSRSHRSSRFTWIHDFEPNLLGLCYFPLNT